MKRELHNEMYFIGTILLAVGGYFLYLGIYALILWIGCQQPLCVETGMRETRYNLPLGIIILFVAYYFLLYGKYLKTNLEKAQRSNLFIITGMIMFEMPYLMRIFTGSISSIYPLLSFLGITLFIIGIIARYKDNKDQFFSSLMIIMIIIIVTSIILAYIFKLGCFISLDPSTFLAIYCN